MPSRRSLSVAFVVVCLLVGAAAVGAAAPAHPTGGHAQRDDGQRTATGGGSDDGGRTTTGSDDDGRRTAGPDDGRGDGRDGGDGGDAGRANVSVRQSGPGTASVEVRNAGADRTVSVRFERMVENPETGLMLREMTVTATDGDYRLTVRTTTRPNASVERYPDASPFGYLDVSHTVPNANVTSASLTVALNRTRLRDRNVSEGNVSLYRYRETDRTWQRLETRVTERNATHVTYRAESPGLSVFAVAPTATPDMTGTGTATTDTASATATRTPTSTATARSPTATPTPTATTAPPTTGGSGPGFGPLAALLAAFAVALRWRER
ncbi:MAG: PGF-pre-PGF domain-containing protein [Haloplanus sp.]